MPGIDMLKREIETMRVEHDTLDRVRAQDLVNMAAKNKKLTRENAEYLDLYIQRNNEIRDLKQRMALLEKQVQQEHNPKEGNQQFQKIKDGMVLKIRRE